MSAIRKAGDIGMKATVLVLLAATVGLLGSTASQFGFLAKRRMERLGNNKKETTVDNTNKPGGTSSS